MMKNYLYSAGKVRVTGLPGELQQRVAVLTDEVLLVVAGDVVPHHSVSVEVVEDGQAGLVVFPLHQELSVVRLRLSGSARGAPGPGDPAVSAAQPHLGTRYIQAVLSLVQILQHCALIGRDHDVDDIKKLSTNESTVT